MVRIMPDWLVENYKLLEEKLQDIILMRRGLLIPHPRDEYDLLEERILESLELKTPRLLKCGHFVPPEDDTDREDEDDDVSVLDDNTGRGSRMSGGTFTEEREWKESVLDAAHASMCTDCHGELKRPGKGVGAGKRRWDIKIYAANGLMRSNAWMACWNDMERCDVEISPWIPDDLRKTLERRVLEEQDADKRKHLYAVELQRQIQESASKQKIAEEEAAERKRLEEVELQKSFEAAAAALERSIEEKAAEKKRFEDAIEEKIAEAKKSIRLEVEAQAQAEATLLADRLRALEVALESTTEPASPTVDVQTRSTVHPVSTLRAADIPLSTLLKNYILVVLKDQRNIIILVLSALVVFLAMHMDTGSRLQMTNTPMHMSLPEAVHTVAITTTATATATTTATAFSTLTVTEIHTAASMQETAPPISHVAAGSASSMLQLDEDTTPSPLVEEQLHNSPAPISPAVEDESIPLAEKANPISSLALEAQFKNDDTCILESVFETALAYCAA
jgi:hypothetical protein